MIPFYLTFDVDGDSSRRIGQPGGPENPDLSDLSLGRFGIVRGLPRILALLGELELPATFFVPGVTVDEHPAAIERIAEAGHEVGHHGYHHFAPTAIPDDLQAEELERGIEAIERCTGARPVGYRAPAWSLTVHTFELLPARGFLYDSSMMGDDRPYVERAGNAALAEIPVHWSLDDYPYLGASLYHLNPGRDVRSVFDGWRAELAQAVVEGRPTGLCFHPEVIGRAAYFVELERFVRELAVHPHVAFTRCADLARDLVAA